MSDTPNKYTGTAFEEVLAKDGNYGIYRAAKRAGVRAVETLGYQKATAWATEGGLTPYEPLGFSRGEDSEWIEGYNIGVRKAAKVVKDPMQHVRYYEARKGIPGIATIAVHMRDVHGMSKSWTDAMDATTMHHAHRSFHGLLV